MGTNKGAWKILSQGAWQSDYVYNVYYSISPFGTGDLRSVEIQDSFPTNDTTLGDAWTVLIGDIHVESNAFSVQTIASDNGALYETAVSSATQYAKIKFTAGCATNGYMGFIMRGEALTASKKYIIYYNCNSGTTWCIYRYDDNTYTTAGGKGAQIGSNFTAFSMADGDSVGVTVQGTGTSTVFKFWKNPVNDVPADKDNWDSSSDTADYTFTPSTANATADTGLYCGADGYIDTGAAGSIKMDDFKAGGILTGSITSGVMTISAAQVGNIGQGCCITYNSLVCYISKVNSPKSFDVVTATGGTPSDQTSVAVTSITHVWASLSAAEAAASGSSYVNNTSLVAANVILNLCCYYDHSDYTLDTTSLDISGYTTDITRYINVYTPIGGTQSINNQRHAGTYTTSKYVLSAASFTLIIGNSYTRIDGLQVNCTSTADDSQAIRLFLTGVGITGLVTNCICRMEAPGASYTDISCIRCTDTTGNNLTVYNCVIFNAGTVGRANGLDMMSGTMTSLNNTIYGFAIGIKDHDWAGTWIATNCAVFSNTDDFNATGGTIDHCASDDLDGTNAVNISPGGTEATDWAACFVDYTSYNFSLKPASVLINTGIDLSASMSKIDITNMPRPQGSVWDIGAFERFSEQKPKRYSTLVRR